MTKYAIESTGVVGEWRKYLHKSIHAKAVTRLLTINVRIFYFSTFKSRLETAKLMCKLHAFSDASVK